MAKKPCPVTRTQFSDHAQAIEVVIGGVPMLAEVRQFSTGSLGWSTTNKTTLVVAGKACKVQVGLNLTLVGSKELPAE